MNIETTLALLSIAGTAVFAASGALVAAGRGYDLVGAVFLSVASGLGGGTIVGVLAGTGVVWLKQPAPLWVALASAIVVFEAVRFVRPPERALVWADAAGLALFTATGMQGLLALGLDPAVTLFLAAIASCGGGVIRDVLANRPPLVFSGEIYVTAAVLGACTYAGMVWGGAGEAWALAATIGVTFLLRAAGIIFHIHLLPGQIAGK